MLKGKYTSMVKGQYLSGEEERGEESVAGPDEQVEQDLRPSRPDRHPPLLEQVQYSHSSGELW